MVTLQNAGGQYIAGEKLRSGKETAEAAINRAGRYKVVRDNLEVKEIVVGEGERRIRYVLVRNPKEVEKQKVERKRIIAEVKEQLKPSAISRGSLIPRPAELIAHPVYGRYVKTDAKGQPVLNEAKIKQEAKLDGKYLLRTSDDTLSAEDVALGYKQLLEVEDAFRSLKQTLELRPVYHRLSDRSRAHVLLCWLALLMIRAAELKTGQTWRHIRAAMAQMHLGDFRSPDGRTLQRTELTLSQKAIFNALGVEEPPLIFAIEPARKPV
ncbi:transposase [Gelria sp. Kuro-4]|uniref:IS1634 family transposase n=1 Tax=Gelria sp. Kuro-4 TaxID=2796927 RepID=UPI001BEFFD0F|nr:transposase [Gelria sp. Kuro-4]BCV24893.1 hypothetical protein kuro4_16660 [Gelria sp. Kuro-4]